jgi:methionyl-tRNA formyltransferase
VRGLRRYGESEELRSAEDIPTGNDIAYLLSCERKVAGPLLARSRHTVVAHASDLPTGRGWSPLAWQVLDGQNVIPITLFEAVDEIDAGPIYLKDSVHFQSGELLPEMQAALGSKIIEMCLRFAEAVDISATNPEPQIGQASHYQRRTPEDSRIDPNRTIADQFDLLRVVDNERYPAFFEHRGRRYILRIEPAMDDG